MLGRAVSLTGLTGVVVAVYLVIVLGLGRSPDDDERTILLLSMVAAAVAAVLYAPDTRAAGPLLEPACLRRAARTRRGAADVRRAASPAPSRSTSCCCSSPSRCARAWPCRPPRCGPARRVTSSASCRSPSAGRRALDLTAEPSSRSSPGPGVRARRGCRCGCPGCSEGRGDAVVRMAPITHSGELLGLHRGRAARRRRAFGEDDESVLAELARQVGLALHNVQLDSALQESLASCSGAGRGAAGVPRPGRGGGRRRAAQDRAQPPRRRPAAPGRAGGHAPAGARRSPRPTPSRPRTCSTSSAHDLQDAVQELRDLAHGIYPPRAHGPRPASPRSSRPRRRARAAGRRSWRDVVGRFPQEVEAAVYFCCLEALQNAAKHAGDGAQATVTIDAGEPEGLSFTVADDGAGFDPAGPAGRGHGFVNMSDRVGAIGGTLEVDSAPGRGTRVSGVVPIDER